MNSSSTSQSNSISIEKKENGNAYEHIQLIRRRFGVDNDLNSTGQLSHNHLQGMLETKFTEISSRSLF